MKKIIFLIIAICVGSGLGFGQHQMYKHNGIYNNNESVNEVLQRVKDFVKWYHRYKQDSTIDKGYIEFIRNPADTTLAIYDSKGIDRLIESVRKVGFVSDKFLHSLKEDFKAVEAQGLPAKYYLLPGLNRVFGLTGDVIFDPDSYDHYFNFLIKGIDKAKVVNCVFTHRRCYIIISVTTGNGTLFPFVLSEKIEGESRVWMIDSIM